MAVPLNCARWVAAMCVAFGGACSIARNAVAEDLSADIVIYGCTVAGVAAAVTARAYARSAIMVCPEDHIGGMTVSGLSWTDFGRASTLGGIAADFYHQIKRHYDQPDTWTKHDAKYYFGWDRDEPYIIAFEPHVAEAILQKMVADSRVRVVHGALLESEGAVDKEGPRIAAIHLTDGTRIAGSIFLDTTYVGDLAAGAGASFVVGREGRDQYDESLNGALHIQADRHPFEPHVSGYVVEGDASSGVLPGLIHQSDLQEGAADDRVQAYNFRVCLTRDPDIRVAFARPADYRPIEYELLARQIKALGAEAFYEEVFQKFDPVPNLKVDKNNSGAVSTDFIGRNYHYPTASYAERREIIDEHLSYTQGLFWFLANDPRVPSRVRNRMASYGLCGDEFVSNGSWPYELYVREARRLVGEMVMTQRHVQGDLSIPDPIALGSYQLDSHHVSRYVDAEGWVHNEGAFLQDIRRAYSVSYRAIVPRRGEVTNLLVPVALSASHAAYGSIRMEPVFMMLGQSAATAAVLAIEQGVSVQDVPYGQLKEALVAEGQVLAEPGPAEIAIDRLRKSKKWVLLVGAAVLLFATLGYVTGRFVRSGRFRKRARRKLVAG